MFHASLCVAALAVTAPDQPHSPHLARSLGLMASSTPERRNTVRVLFYGQSITEQHWWKAVAADLRARYPHADFVIENRAIGGHSSQKLVRTAESDLYPFQPDLLIFHVYGSHTDYETIIRRTRERTCADILQMSDHLAAADTIDEPTDPAGLTPMQWNPWMNTVFLPGVSKKYGTEFCEVRKLWKEHLRANKLEPKALLRDGVHLNDAGCDLMAKIVSAYLRPPADAKDDDRVRTIPVNGVDKATVELAGNRYDLIGEPGAAGPWDILIDGKPPSEHPDLVATTRVSAFPRSNWPVLLSVGHETARVPEKWEVTIIEVDPPMKVVKFRVRGSVTGDDGEGVSTEKFVSKSGRVVIEPDDWNLAYCAAVFKRPLKLPHVATWDVMPQGVDRVAAFPNRGPGLESAVTIAQGLADGEHTLEVRGPVAGLRAVRVYRPSGK